MTSRRRALRVLFIVGLAVITVGVAIAFLVDSGAKKADPTIARRKNAAVTEADNGGEVTIPSGKPFIVDLEGSADAPWDLPQAASEAMARVSTSQDLDGSAAATFTPLEASSGVLITANRVPVCLADSPPCDKPRQRFEVTVRVVR